jgi:non-canonical purine NTP pyrophosphatase (RdgB/HAM1 family)
VRVVFASSNPGKAREASLILAGSGLEVQTVDMWLGDLETGTTFLENARLKAIAAARILGAPVLAEDSGLEVDALGGLPGLHSARFAGPAATDGDNNAKLLRLLVDVPDGERTARYRAVAVLILPSGAEVKGEGTLEGHITRAARGTGGFGYDPIFTPDGKRTTAELSADEKNALSHRGRALRRLAENAKSVGLV